MNHQNGTAIPEKAALSKPAATITAVEEDQGEEDDVIPGPPVSPQQKSRPDRSSHSNNSGGATTSSTRRKFLNLRGKREEQPDPLQISSTDHQWAGQGILASRRDLELPAEEFAAGCNLLQAAARGDARLVEETLKKDPKQVNFRDYDRRTALHVAASEGHLPICKLLIEKFGSRINRSDRWGGSPLDDAHRHRHEVVISYLRSKGAMTGSANKSTNLITAAAQGDLDEVQMLLQVENLSDKSTQQKLDINKGDYDKRTALHLAAGEGHVEIVKVLCDMGADPNCEDRWNRRPLDDAITGQHEECQRVLIQYGAQQSTNRQASFDELGASGRRSVDNMKVNFDELELIDRIGAGAFGEIYKCRWRGTLVAAKIIKTAKIRKDWTRKHAMDAIANGEDVDEAIKALDDAEGSQENADDAVEDFRREISVLKSLRHPHIVLMLAYSTTSNYECIVSELMKCSLLDIFKSHMVQGTRMSRKNQIVYATQLSLGMNYLHTCSPPIIHRDLKPANLLIDHSGVLKISDFGLSKVRPKPEMAEKEAYTMTGETGSYRFMAPEVYRHEEYDETVDVYSFAMIFFYLLIGRPPWPALPGLEAVRKAALEGDRPNIPRDVDVRLQSLLKETWDDNPKVRPPFSKISKALAAYNKDVYKTDTNTIASAEADAGCKCNIL
uniref:Protein kinase domain-containing protein n=1 Tax=Amphora coffeiformis TaxID=265554 RepID=A0A7S3L3V8_9STRA